MKYATVQTFTMEFSFAVISQSGKKANLRSYELEGSEFEIGGGFGYAKFLDLEGFFDGNDRNDALLVDNKLTLMCEVKNI